MDSIRLLELADQELSQNARRGTIVIGERGAWRANPGRAMLRNEMSRPKRQRIVAKSFLRRFADGKDRVTVVHRDEPSRTFTANVENVLAEKDFYNAPVPGAPNPWWLETRLSEVEGEAVAALARIDSGQFPPVGRDRDVVRTAVALGLLRGYRMRHAIIQVHAAMKIEPLPTRDELREQLQIAFKLEPHEEDVDAFLAQMDRDRQSDGPLSPYTAALLAPLLCDMVSSYVESRTWHLLTFEEPCLLTGDAPVALNDNDLSRPLGIDCDEIVMPIDPSNAIFLLKDAKHDGTRQTGTPELATRLNFTVATQCMKWIVHHPETTPLTELPPIGTASATFAPERPARR